MKKILIIEDDMDIAEIERDYLAVSGCEAVIETDGVSGLNTALKGGFDLILLDICCRSWTAFPCAESSVKSLIYPYLW